MLNKKVTKEVSVIHLTNVNLVLKNQFKLIRFPKNVNDGILLLNAV